MPKVISASRIGRSMVSPSGATNEVSRVLDFQMAADQGIYIDWVLGYGNFHDDSPTPSDTVPVAAVAHQTLHLESGATEDLDVIAGEDDDELDTEIFYAQTFNLFFIVGNTVTFGSGGGVYITPNGLLVYPEPIVAVRNITHKGSTVGADQDLEAGVLFSYRFIELSDAELGAQLARR